MVETRPGGSVLGCLVGCWVALSSSPPSDCISFPSMMTWAPCPHGVRTRGKKKTYSLVKKHSRIWTSNLPSRRRFSDNPSFGCPPLPGTCRQVGHRPLGGNWFRPDLSQNGYGRESPPRTRRCCCYLLREVVPELHFQILGGGQILVVQWSVGLPSDNVVFVRLSVAIHLQGPLQRGSGSPGRTSCRFRLCSHQPGQPARLQTGTKCGRKIGSRKPSHVVQPTGRHLANRHHLHPRGSPDCLRPEICPLVPCFAQCGCKK